MSKTIRIAFYRESKSLFSHLIRFKQYRLASLPNRHARYTHVEIIFGDDWYSSSIQDGGTRKKQIVDNGNWDYINLSVEDSEYKTALEWCEKNTGNRYNRTGIFFSQFLKTLWFRREGDFFCSEYVTRALQEIKMMCGVDAVFVSPGQVHQYFDRRPSS